MRELGGAALLAALVAGSLVGAASAYTVTITAAAPQTIYLQVGVGSFTNNYNVGGTPQNNATIDVVSTTVAAAAVGNGTAQAMTADTPTTNSYYDGYSVLQSACPRASSISEAFFAPPAPRPRRTGHRHRAGGADQRRRQHHSVFKNQLDLGRHRRSGFPASRALSLRHLRQRRRAERGLHGQQHLERELLDVSPIGTTPCRRPARSPAWCSTR